MAEAAAGTVPRDVELSDQGGEQRYDKIESKKEEKPPLPDFFPSHGLTTARKCSDQARAGCLGRISNPGSVLTTL
jgi:hypothetical protein